MPTLLIETEQVGEEELQVKSFIAARVRISKDRTRYAHKTLRHKTETRPRRSIFQTLETPRSRCISETEMLSRQSYFQTIKKQLIEASTLITVRHIQR